jgi:hypothetical protein
MAATSIRRITQMAGKLLYSRVLQNRLAKNQGSQVDSVDHGSAAAKPPQQYYSSSAPPASQYNDYPAERRSYNNAYPDGKYERPEGNKIRRGPGRRLAKEKDKRMRNMDPALMQKYASLPESMQEKVNAAIEICYQQHMANVYKNPGRQDDSHYDQDVEIDPDEAFDTREFE